MAMTRKQADNIKIDEDIIVGFSGSGGDVRAEQLAKWAYRRLEKWPELLDALKRAYFLLETNCIKDDYFAALRMGLGDLLPSQVVDITLVTKAIANAEKYQANCDRNDCRYYTKQAEFADKCKECLENCAREHPEGFNHFEAT